MNVALTHKPNEDRSCLEAAARGWREDDTKSVKNDTKSVDPPKPHSKSVADCLARAIEEHKTLVRRLEALLDRVRAQEKLNGR
jgi:hypothetical protein